MTQFSDNPPERLTGSSERVTFHAAESGFCVLQVNVRGQRDLVTVVGSAAAVSAGEYVECTGSWHNDRTHQTKHLQIVPPSTLEGRQRISTKKYLSIFCQMRTINVHNSTGGGCAAGG